MKSWKLGRMVGWVKLRKRRGLARELTLGTVDRVAVAVVVGCRSNGRMSRRMSIIIIN